MSLHVLIAAAALGQAPSDAAFEKLRDQIVPTAAELKWRALPWRPTLREGVEAAHREEKPVLLYVMNGHPLGCT
jgi:hypothetical protein